jgi:hypothetical protein
LYAPTAYMVLGVKTVLCIAAIHSRVEIQRGKMLEIIDETLTVKNPIKAPMAGKCSCGGWLVLAGPSYIGPRRYMIERRCVSCKKSVVDQKTTTK